MPNCLVCESEIAPFMTFGRMPIANGFLTEDQFAEEPFYELPVGFCDRCKMVQLTELVEPSKMFHENYAFFSSLSAGMSRHFEAFAKDVIDNYLGDDPLVLEIGSNDGIMLRHFADRGIRHLGIEPSANVAAEARKRGVNTISEFFGEELARRIVAEHGHADAFLSANVMCHIPTIHSVMAGIALLLKPKGVLIFEDPYLGDIIEKTSYDQIYDEHAFYFSVLSLDNLLERHGLEIIDVQPQPTHGGSMRYVIGHKGARPVSPAVERQREKERRLELDKAETYERFRANVERSRDELMALLRKLRSENKRVVGYGATSKSTTVTNYCGITPELVEFVSDTTPIKQGKFTPGAHIPVKPRDAFAEAEPDYALLFAWNHAEEIKAKEQEFTARGGRWIVYVPGVGVEA